MCAGRWQGVQYVRACMCPCAHIVGAHMLGTVSKNGFSLLSKPWHHYWIILSLLLPSWCGIVHFGGRVQGSAARAFFARMCAGMAARPVCRRAYASWDNFQTWNPTMGSHCLASFGTIIIESYYYYYYTIALWCGIVHFGGSLLGSAARAFFARMCAGMAARPVCARMCLCAHTVGKHMHHMLVRPVCKLGILYDGFSLLGKLWQHYSIIYTYIIFLLLLTLWRRILEFGGSLLGSAARVFLARMCAGMAAPPVCARICARSFQAWNPTMAFDCFASFVSIISQYSFVVQVCAF